MVKGSGKTDQRIRELHAAGMINSVIARELKVSRQHITQSLKRLGLERNGKYLAQEIPEDTPAEDVCRNGHMYLVYGVSKHGQCKECLKMARKRSRDKRKEERAAGII